MTPWLTSGDVKAVIDGIPDSFDLGAKLRIPVANTVRAWLTDLMGLERVTLLQTALESQTPTDEQTAYMLLIKPFLAFAAWSEYLANANVTITDTGPVEKNRQNSSSISADQRDSLSRHYLALAKREAQRIARKVEGDTACRTSSAGSGRPQVSLIGGVNTSYFQ